MDCRLKGRLYNVKQCNPGMLFSSSGGKQIKTALQNSHALWHKCFNMLGSVSERKSLKSMTNMTAHYLLLTQCRNKHCRILKA